MSDKKYDDNWEKPYIYFPSDEEYVCWGEDENAGEMSIKRSKLLIAFIAVIFISLTVTTFLLVYSAGLSKKEKQLEEELASERTKFAELQAEADALCIEKLQRYSTDQGVDFTTFMASYGYDKVDVFSFQSTSGEKLSLSPSGEMMQFVDIDGTSYQYTLAQQPTSYVCLLDTDVIVPFSDKDVEAIGRVMIRDTSSFDKN